MCVCVRARACVRAYVCVWFPLVKMLFFYLSFTSVTGFLSYVRRRTQGKSLNSDAVSPGTLVEELGSVF